MNKRNKMLILILAIIGMMLVVTALSGCTKKERYTLDEDGVGKDEWWDIDFTNNLGTLKDDMDRLPTRINEMAV